MTFPLARWPSAFAGWDDVDDELRSEAATAAFARFERAAIHGVFSVGLNSGDVAVLPRVDDDNDSVDLSVLPGSHVDNDEQAASVNSSGAVFEACDSIDCFFSQGSKALEVEEAGLDSELGEMLQTMRADQSLARKRQLCCAMLGMLVAKKRKREIAVKYVLKLKNDLLDAYIKYRGGMQQIRTYEIPAVLFDIDTLGEKEIESYFRFTKVELQRLQAALRIPQVIVTYAGDKCSGFEVLCMLCLSYAYPGRRFEMIKMFGTGTSRLSRLIAHLRTLLHATYYPGMCNPKILSPEKIEEYAVAVFNKCGVAGIFSFIDGTVRPTLKPELFQGVVYTGKDKTHALKYQMLCTPDGVMRHISGPFCGSRHDQHMVHKSEVLNWVTQHGRSPAGVPYVCYADAGYAVAPGLMRPFPDDAINIEHKAFNDVLSSVRVCVEWEFGDVVVYWAAVNFKPQQIISRGTKPGQQYIVACLLSNCHNCLRPGKTSAYFAVPPPTLEEYVESLRL